MRLTEEQIAELLKDMGDLLRHPGVEVDITRARGIVRWPGDDGWMKAAPTDGETFTIVLRKNGGAREIEA